jgi:hypothetical protein
MDVARLYGTEMDIIADVGADSRSWSAAGRAQILEQLEALVHLTGGQLLYSANDDRTAASVDGMVESLHNVYEIGFYSSESFSELPNIEIRIRNRPDLTVFPVSALTRFEK